MSKTKTGGARTAAASPPSPYPAEKARQGQIILDRPWRRFVFFGAFILLFVLLLVLAVAS